MGFSATGYLPKKGFSALLVAALVVELPLTGCMITSAFIHREPRLAQVWSFEADARVGTQAAVDAEWWKSFQDPALDRLIELAYQQNLPLQVSGLRIAEARAQVGIALGDQFPEIDAVGAITKEQVSNRVATGPVLDRNFSNYQAGFDAVWEVDFWGKYRGEVKARRAQLEASKADYQNALVSLSAEVARTYTLLRTNEVLLELAHENVRLQEEGLRIADARLRFGTTTELDVSQARSLLESTRATIPEIQAQLDQSLNAMSVLLGEPPGAVQDLLCGPQAIPVAPATVAIGVPAQLLRRRADIRSAEWNALAQFDRIGVAKSDFFPSFTILGNFGWEAGDRGDIFEEGSDFYSFGPSVRWPILNFGRIRNNVRAQDARFQQAVVNYHDTVLRAAQEVEDALTGFLNSQDSFAATQNSRDAARRSVEIAFVQYREGAVDFQRVIDTQRELLQEENNLAQTQSLVATYLIALYKALGGGWEVREGRPVIADCMRAEMEQRTHWGDLLEPAVNSSEGDVPCRTTMPNPK